MEPPPLVLGFVVEVLLDSRMRDNQNMVVVCSPSWLGRTEGSSGQTVFAHVLIPL